MGEKDNIFIPMSVEQSTNKKSNYFFSIKKGVLMALALLPGVVWVPYIALLTMGRITGLILGILSYAVIMLFVVRFVIFEELTWKRIFRNLEKNKLSSYKHFWGIDRIESNGVIHYKYSGESSLRKAMVLKLVRGSKIGKGRDFEERYIEINRKMLNMLLSEGLGVDIYTALDEKEVPYNVQRMYRQAQEIEDELTREIALEHINNLAYQTKSRKRLEVVYWVVYFEDPSKFKDMVNIVKRLRDIADTSRLYKISKVLRKTEVEYFLSRYLCINVIPAISERGKVEDISKYGEVVRVFDEDGNEIWVEGDLGKNSLGNAGDEGISSGEEGSDEILGEDNVEVLNKCVDLDELEGSGKGEVDIEDLKEIKRNELLSYMENIEDKEYDREDLNNSRVRKYRSVNNEGGDEIV